MVQLGRVWIFFIQNAIAVLCYIKTLQTLVSHFVNLDTFCSDIRWEHNVCQDILSDFCMVRPSKAVLYSIFYIDYWSVAAWTISECCINMICLQRFNGENGQGFTLWYNTPVCSPLTKSIAVLNISLYIYYTYYQTSLFLLDTCSYNWKIGLDYSS